jgi:cation transport ATPase
VVRALEELPGVQKAYASYAEKRAAVNYDQSTVTPDQMCQALLKAGYSASPQADNNTDPAVSDSESPKTGFLQRDNLICYCFEYTKGDIEQDFTKNGRSLIMEKIAAEKKAGGCDCATKNPKGR